MTKNPVGWFEIYVQDMSRARNFYESVFNVKLERLDNPGPEMWAFPMVQGSLGAPGSLVKMEGFPSGRNSVLVYFSCADCADQEARVIEAGGKIHQGKTPIGQYGFISLVTDTESNMFGLHSMQ